MSLRALKWQKRYILIVVSLLFTLVSTQALTPIFMSQVTRGFLYGGNTPDCTTNTPLGPLNPYLGGTVTANIIENSQTLPVINSLGGNPVSQMDICLPNGNLVKLGCSAGYAGYNGGIVPDDYVGALEYTPYDVDTNGNVRCEQYKTLPGGNQGAYTPGVILKPAFFHPIYPGYSYSNPNNPGPIATLAISCPQVTLTATPVTSPYRSISNLWVEGPAPYQAGQNIIAMGGGCLPGQVCNITATLPSSGTYHSYVSEYDPSTLSYTLTVDAFYC